MVARPVAGLHRDQLVVTEAQHRELVGFRRAEGDGAVIAGGKPGDLQLEVALVGPEPGQRPVWGRLAEQPSGHVACLVGGVLHGFQAGRPLAVLQAGEAGHVAESGDVRIGGQQIGVHADAVLDGQARFAGQLGVGDHADAEDHQVGRQLAPIRGFHAADLTIAAFDAGQALAEVEFHSPGLVRLAKQLGHIRRNGARHRPIAELQHMHAGAQFGGYRGEFQADEAGADYHHVAYFPH
jgi:hypothetical protein